MIGVTVSTDERYTPDSVHGVSCPVSRRGYCSDASTGCFQHGCMSHQNYAARAVRAYRPSPPPPPHRAQMESHLQYKQARIAATMQHCRYSGSTVRSSAISPAQPVYQHVTGTTSSANLHPSRSRSGDMVECPSTMIECPDVDEAAATSNSVSEELRRFAEQFRLRRMRLGATQADVGAALAQLRATSTPLSQSTICRFESMTLSCSNMQALRPALNAWLAAAESQYVAETGDGDPRAPAWTWSSAGVRRRRRTIIAGPDRRSLEAYFAAESRPSSERMADIANTLGLNKSVVRVWYCNERQKQKRLRNWQ